MLSLASFVLAGTFANAEEPAKSRNELREPIYRVTKQETQLTKTATAALVTPGPDPSAVASVAAPAQPSVVKPPKEAAKVAETHPLDVPLKMATKALKKSQAQFNDYSGILVKRERVSGRLNDQQYMFAKIRNEKLDANQKVTTPFGVYLKFLKPSNVKGREVIYVKGQNNGKIVAHEGGLKGRFTPSLYLDPNGALAMMGQRYPVTDIGIENLCRKLLERGGRDRSLGHPCEVTTQPAKINGRPATRIQLVHPERKPQLDFHIARIFVDNQFGLPVRYEAYDWPATKGADVSESELIEEYTYVKLKFNVGLTDLDFDPENKKYNMK